jgi:signal transduction histidine kinase/ligand-binding sensor domain-containing protein/CheY-like chemotaxis protein/AraC-like DNA-binding protein
VLSLLTILPAHGYSPVKYLGMEQGLSNDAVTSITQDQYGFIWIGTYNGLNRYDGSAFRVFRNVWGERSSLVNNHIKAINAVGNKVFVGTENGLMYYSYEDSRFHQVFCRSKNSSDKVPITSTINQIVSDGNGNTFIASSNQGLLLVVKSDTVADQIPFHNQNSYDVHALTIDKSNRLWLFSDDAGLCIYHPRDQRVDFAAHVVNAASALTSDLSGRIWIGTDNGLYVFNPADRTSVAFGGKKKELSSVHVYGLTRTANGDIWISTNGGGVNIWDSRKNELTYLRSGETQASLKSSAVTDVYEDNEKRIWIATLRGGVNIIEGKSLPFHSFRHENNNKNSVINNFILSFCEDENKNIWIGTDGGGLSYWDTQKNNFTNYLSKPGSGNLSSDFVVSIIKDYQNKIWIASFNGGIDAFDKSKKQFKHYPCKYSSGSEEKHFWKLYEDAQHRIWAGATWGGSLFLYNRQKDCFELFDKSLTDIHALFQDHSGQLWAGDYTHLIRMDVLNKRFRKFDVGQPIRDINEDKLHHLWLGTDGGGLIQFNTDNFSSRRLTEKQGLPDNSVLRILIDTHENLWCSTFNGLSKYNPSTGKFTNYFLSDGLQSNQFNYNAAVLLSSGKMLFGGIKGFNMFYPDSIVHYSHTPQLQLTDFRVNNSSFEQNRNLGNPTSLYQLQQLTVPFNQATLSVSYTALEYSFPEKIAYAYYLEGWDHDWNYVGKLKTAYYSRLNEGNYVLKIKATNTEGNWDSLPLMIHIRVLPPWYRTWWAYVLYISAIVGLGYWFWNDQIRQAKLKFAVQLANLEVQREKELNEKKLSFFTNVSHEFRTPLTLIINPIKDLLKTRENNEELRTVYRNSKRLLALVDQLLLFRKTDSENLKLMKSTVNIVHFTREVYLCFVHQAKIKNITYFFECEQELIEANIDREKIQIALFNLISNAIKFTTTGGKISITLKADNEMVYFEIVDSGIGIADDVGERLFEKYYQVKDSDSLETGFGIGLYLAKTFIEEHQGTIAYRSLAGMGTTFSLRFPRDNSYDLTQAGVIHSNEWISDTADLDETSENACNEDTAGQLVLLLSEHQTILVIDDNDEIRTYIKKIFSDQFTILEASDGDVALSLVKKHLPDIVISDVVMPGLNGLELCKAIKQDPALSHIPVILLTGESFSDIQLKGLEEGAVDFLSKPFDKDLLIARVKGIIRNRSDLQNYFFNEVTLNDTTKNISEEHKDFLYKCIKIIEERLLEPELEVSTIADEMGIGYSTLYKKIKQITGQSINGFIRFVRLRKAAELLINTHCNVNEAAYRVGYNDVKYFRGHFHKQFGLNPSEFIKKHRATFQRSYSINEIKL